MEKTIEKPWYRLTKAEKRIRIAQDVISSIKSRVYTANTGTYISTSQFTDYFDRDESIQNILKNERAKECRVCALGACLLTLVKFENKLKVNELKDVEWSVNTPASEELSIRSNKRLGKYFSIEQLGLIESAFETNYVYARDLGVDKRLVDKAVKYGEKWDDSERRLLNIMRDIIRNGGEFKP